MTEDTNTLENRLNHPSFPQPSNPNQKVWRYMDLAKFTWLLSESKITLIRADLFQDQHEGSLTYKAAELMELASTENGEHKLYSTLSDAYQEIKGITYISCWHGNDHESDAMWRHYSGIGGLAIQTSYKSLASSLEECPDTYIGAVKYIDYHSEVFEGGNIFNPCMHKRVSFEYEKEIRLVQIPFKYYKKREITRPSVINIPWNCEEKIDSIIISPYSPTYYYEAVVAIVKSLAPRLSDKIKLSDLSRKPTYGVR
ncbi:hypothetical protein [Delftia sp. ASV31]|uniref:hypothetical protein n=1 Tax=Delftia sp. ASV31 TaxID=2795113 RepID=UPI0018ED2A1D|nr:hypothetical protein [Delftia sp. ASV31]